MIIIYSCPDPDCTEDLVRDTDGWYCPACQHVVADTKLLGDPDD